MSLMVQSTQIVKLIKSTIPASRPACLNAYGWPMIPAPMMELAMFINALRNPDFGLERSRSAQDSKSSSPQGEFAKATEGASMFVRRGVNCCWGLSRCPERGGE